MSRNCAATRVRKDGKDADRVTGNMVWLCRRASRYAPDQRGRDVGLGPASALRRAQRDLGRCGKRWKALKVREIFELRKYFTHRFDLRMSAGLAELGYEIETKMQAGEDGMRYRTWDIKAAPGLEAEWQSVNDKNSRRHQEIEAEEERIVADEGARSESRRWPVGGGARTTSSARTTRQGKRKDMTLRRSARRIGIRR